MRVLWVLLVLVGMVVMIIPPSTYAADAYLTTPSQVTVDVPAGSGTAAFKVYITNGSNVDRAFSVSHWSNYMIPNSGYVGVSDNWITKFSPNNFTLSPQGESIVNVEVNIPEGIPSAKYITWLKVRDDPVSEERPIVVVIRTGEAVPRYEYSMEPSFYQLNAIFVEEEQDSGSNRLTLTVKNTSPVQCGYRLYVPHKFTVNGEEWRDGNIYQPIYKLECADTVEEIKDIIMVAAPQVNGKQVVSDSVELVDGHSKRELPFYINIPSEVPDGYYEARVGVQIADGGIQGTTVGVQYECRLLIHVIHQDISESIRASWWPSWWMFAIGIVGVGLVGVVVFKWRS